MFFFQLQDGQAVRSYVTGIDTEIRSAAGVFAGVTEGFAERLLRTKLSATGDGCKDGQNQYCEDRSMHGSFLLFTSSTLAGSNDWQET
jgi:hypothetical protein